MQSMNLNAICFENLSDNWGGFKFIYEIRERKNCNLENSFINLAYPDLSISNLKKIDSQGQSAPFSHHKTEIWSFCHQKFFLPDLHKCLLCNFKRIGYDETLNSSTIRYFFLIFSCLFKSLKNKGTKAEHVNVSFSFNLFVCFLLVSSS